MLPISANAWINVIPAMTAIWFAAGCPLVIISAPITIQQWLAALCWHGLFVVPLARWKYRFFDKAPLGNWINEARGYWLEQGTLYCALSWIYLAIFFLIILLFLLFFKGKCIKRYHSLRTMTVKFFKPIIKLKERYVPLYYIGLRGAIETILLTVLEIDIDYMLTSYSYTLLT